MEDQRQRAKEHCSVISNISITNRLVAEQLVGERRHSLDRPEATSPTSLAILRELLAVDRSTHDRWWNVQR